MIAGNFTGPELKMLLKESSLASLSQIVANGDPITQYLRSLRELHKMCVRKEYSPDHQEYIDTFEQRFKVVREMKLISFTTKCHIILSHIPTYMRETQQSLYTADTSPQESTHSGFKNCQRAHNLLSTHNLGSAAQQSRLKRSMLRYNWNNLTFDLRDQQQEDPTSLDTQPEEELENLDKYVQQGDKEDEPEEEHEEETETIDAVRQVKLLSLIKNAYC